MSFPYLILTRSDSAEVTLSGGLLERTVNAVNAF